VEVLSPSTAAEDRGPKRLEYERVGVREYYLFDPSTGEVEGFRLVSGAYAALPSEKAGFASGVLGQTWEPASVVAR
jgi:Uma2 family endonuclease